MKHLTLYYLVVLYVLVGYASYESKVCLYKRIQELAQDPSTQIYLKISDIPVVSIVIPVFNHSQLTRQCLCSLMLTKNLVPCEVIIVDDNSTDDTAALLASVHGIRVLTNSTNKGFLRSANAGATQAHGDYIVFLNNDTVVTDGWLDELISASTRFSAIGAVGSQLLFPNGKLQEAGCCVHSSGLCQMYGFHDNPANNLYQFTRFVDYCSGAALLVKKDVFTLLHGFDELFAPGYYEENDLCFRMRSLGLRILYEPKSVVFHIGGATMATGQHPVAGNLVDRNRKPFIERWGTTIKNFPHMSKRLSHLRHYTNHMLIVGSMMRTKTFPRLLNALHTLVDHAWKITVLDSKYIFLDDSMRHALQEHGIEILSCSKRMFINEWVPLYGNLLDVVVMPAMSNKDNMILALRKASQKVLLCTSIDGLVQYCCPQVITPMSGTL